MNMNEVLASLAARAGVDVHPNDHVNASQSSNDTFPTSIHVAATLGDRRSDLVPALDHLAAALEAKAEEFADAGEVRPHPPDGRDPGDARPGVRRLRRDDALRGIERLEAALPRVARAARSAAPRSAPASTPRPASPRG